MQRARKEMGGKRREREWEKEEDACEYVDVCVCVCWRARARTRARWCGLVLKEPGCQPELPGLRAR